MDGFTEQEMNKEQKNSIIEKIKAAMSPDYRLLYATVSGSHLYGTSSPESDLDVKFVFMPSVRDCILGIDSRNININTSNDHTRNTKDDIDIQGWSIQFFVELLRRGDTNAIDILYSYTNEDCLVYCDNAYAEMIIANHDMLYDHSNMRGILGYVVSQSERYGLKGTRFSKLVEINKIIDSYKDRIATEDELKLSDISDEIIERVGDSTYCMLTETEDNRKAIRICGKVHLLDISMREFIRRLDLDLGRYGERTKKSMDGSDWKALSHAYRGIIQGLEILAYKKITFPLRGAYSIKAIKNGEYERDHVNDLIALNMEKLKCCLDKTEKNKVNVNEVNNLILSLYKIF